MSMSEKERDDIWRWLKEITLVKEDNWKSDWDLLYEPKKPKEWDE